MNNIFTNKKIYQMLGSKGPAKTEDTYRKGGKKPILTAAQKEKRRQNKENSDSSSTRKYPTGNEGSNKPGGPALISGKKPKAKGKTTPNTNRLGKTLYDKGKEFLGNVAGHAIQGVKDDVKTLGKVFKRNAKRGQK